MLVKSINSILLQSKQANRPLQTMRNFSRVAMSTMTTYEKTFMASDLIIKKRDVLKPKPAADH